eukprot:479767-Prymnesium_polylepis.1
MDPGSATKRPETSASSSSWVKQQGGHVFMRLCAAQTGLNGCWGAVNEPACAQTSRALSRD